MKELPKRPATSELVIDCLVWKGWNPGIAFYEGSRVCRRLDAKLIRETVAELRGLQALSRDVHALVEAVDLRVGDDELCKDWRDAIDGLRVLFHASPIGTARERNLLLNVARNPRVVSAMQVALKSEHRVDPTWMAVLIAEGSTKSQSIVDRFRKDYATRNPKLLRALELFSGALDVAPNHTAVSPGARAAKSASVVVGTTRPGDLDRFWEIVDRAGGSGDHAESLRELLEGLSAREVAAFHRHFFSMLRKAYRYDLWGAAYLMMGGCSEDGFRDFRADLIGRGHVVFERVLKDPDWLADNTDVQGDETLANVANDVYVGKTGKDLPVAAGERRHPVGKRWNFDDDHEMRRRYPRLYGLSNAK
jgi:hypothetical protein